jgi:hypothetical protein
MKGMQYPLIFCFGAATGIFWFANDAAPYWAFKLLGSIGILVTVSFILLTTPLPRYLDRLLRLTIGQK